MGWNLCGSLVQCDEVLSQLKGEGNPYNRRMLRNGWP